MGRTGLSNSKTQTLEGFYEMQNVPGKRFQLPGVPRGIFQAGPIQFPGELRLLQRQLRSSLGGHFRVQILLGGRLLL